MFATVRCLLVAVALALGPLAYADVGGHWEQPGAAVVRVVYEQWEDAARSRTVPVKLYVPEGTGSHPVILFSHGLGGSREGGRAWGELWASHGYLCIHLQHPGSDESLWKGTPPRGRVQALRQGATGQELVARVGDVRFVLDELARRWQAGQGAALQADLARVGMSGHSFGAITTQAVSGQRYRARSGSGELIEPRVSAAIALSPSAPGRGRDADERFAAIAIPFFGITGTEDGDVLATGATPENRRLPVRHMPAPHKYLLVLAGADHMFFNGQPGLRRPRNAASDAQMRLVQAATTAFWDAHLKDDAAARRWLADGGFAAALGKDGEFLAR